MGAEECISPERLEKALEDHLGYAAIDPTGELVVQGTVTRQEGPVHYRAEVELRDRQGSLLGRRDVEARGTACNALDEALVLVLSLAIDTQLAVLAARATQPARAPAVEPSVEPEPVEEVSPPEPPPEAVTRKEPSTPEGEPRFDSGVKLVRIKRSGSAFGLLLAVGSGLSVGLMPASAWNLGLTLGFRTPSLFGVELSGVFFPFGRVPTDQGQIDFRAGLAELRGCAPFLRAPLLLDGCVGLWNGVLRANAKRFDDNMARTGPLSGATAQVRAAYDFGGRYFVRLMVGLGIPFVRDRFVAVGSQGARVVLHRLSPVMGNLGADLGIHFR